MKPSFLVAFVFVAFSIIGLSAVSTEAQAPTHPPFANAGQGASTTVGMSHTHSGAWAHDRDNNLARYEWAWQTCPGTCPTLSGNVSGSLTGGNPSVWIPRGPTFTPTTAGSHVLRLTVTDTAGASDSATVSFTVAVIPPALDDPPFADAGQGASVPAGASHTHSGAWAHDADNNLARYEWAWQTCPGTCPTFSGNVSGILTGGNPSIWIPQGPTFTPTTAGSHVLRLTVTDTTGAATSATVSFTVVGAPPTITASLTASLTAGTVGQQFHFTATRTGGTATGTVTFTNPQCGTGGTLVAGSYTGNTDNTFSCTYATEGSRAASMTVSQGGVSAIPTASVTVERATVDLCANMTCPGPSDCTGCEFSHPCQIFASGTRTAHFCDQGVCRSRIEACSCARWVHGAQCGSSCSCDHTGCVSCSYTCDAVGSCGRNTCSSVSACPI